MDKTIHRKLSKIDKLLMSFINNKSINSINNFIRLYGDLQNYLLNSLLKFNIENAVFLINNFNIQIINLIIDDYSEFLLFYDFIIQFVKIKKNYNSLLNICIEVFRDNQNHKVCSNVFDYLFCNEYILSDEFTKHENDLKFEICYILEPYIKLDYYSSLIIYETPENIKHNFNIFARKIKEYHGL